MCKISRKNSKWLLRKWQTTLGDTFFAAHCISHVFIVLGQAKTCYILLDTQPRLPQMSVPSCLVLWFHWFPLSHSNWHNAVWRCTTKPAPRCKSPLSLWLICIQYLLFSCTIKCNYTTNIANCTVPVVYLYTRPYTMTTHTEILVNTAVHCTLVIRDQLLNSLCTRRVADNHSFLGFLGESNS